MDREGQAEARRNGHGFEKKKWYDESGGEKEERLRLGMRAADDFLLRLRALLQILGSMASLGSVSRDQGYPTNWQKVSLYHSVEATGAGRLGMAMPVMLTFLLAFLQAASRIVW